MAEMVRLRERQRAQRAERRAAEALQLVLNLGGWAEPVRVALNAALLERSLNGQGWEFGMIATKQEVALDFVKLLRNGPHYGSTAVVWITLLTFVKPDDGLILCSQTTLAKSSGFTRQNVNKALKRLVEIGALQELGDGRYRVHPTLFWHGYLDKREEAEAKAPPLALGKKRKLALVET